MRRKDKRILPLDSPPRPLILGHRGCSKAAPENTLAAFQKLLDYKIPGVELDVQLCKTGELVVLHDFNLKRTTGVDALACETALQAIKELDAGSWFDESFIGEEIPTLDEVFDLLGSGMFYDIEIKNVKRTSGELERALVNKIRKRNLQGHVIISSFNPLAVRKVREIAPELNTAIIYSNSETLPWYLHHGEGRHLCKPNTLKPDIHRCTSFNLFIERKIRGYHIITWTVDKQSDFQQCIDWGVDGIITNVPEKLIPFFASTRNKQANPLY